MAFNKPALKDGIEDFLNSYKRRNRGFDYGQFLHIMGLPISDTRKAQRVRDEVGHQSINTAKRWMAQWRHEYEQIES